MPKSKTRGLALAVLLAAAAIAAWVFFARLGPAIKSAIVTDGALATQTQVLVGSVEFSPLTGAGALDGLTVGNPAGFSSPYAVVVNRIVLQAESGSLLGGGPLIVDSATIIAPQITYEASSPSATSNLETIRNNAQAYAATPAAIQAGGAARKLIIRDLTIIGGSLTLDLPLPGAALTVPLPPLDLTNIGADTNGATPPEIIRIVCAAIADEARQAVTAAIAGKVKSALAILRPLARLPKSLPHLPSPPGMPSPLPDAAMPPQPDMLPPPPPFGMLPPPPPPGD